MKKICWLLILVLLIGCFAGCQSTQSQEPSEPAQPQDVLIENPDGTLSDQMKEEIREAYAKKLGTPPGWYDEGEKYGLRYYGTYNDYTIIFEKFWLECESRLELANYEIKYSSSFRLWAYQDGEFYDIEDVYNQGLITDEDVKSIYEAHCRDQEKLADFRKQQG